MFIPTDCVRIVSFRGIQMYNKQSKAIFCFFWKNFGFICPQRIRQVSVYVSTIFFFFQKHISVAELNINIVTGRFTFFLSFFRFWCISYIIYAWTSTCRRTNRWVAIYIYIYIRYNFVMYVIAIQIILKSPQKNSPSSCIISTCFFQ